MSFRSQHRDWRLRVNRKFDFLITSRVLANTLLMGLQTNLEALYLQQSGAFEVWGDYCITFVFEYVLRIGFFESEVTLRWISTQR